MRKVRGPTSGWDDPIFALPDRDHLAAYLSECHIYERPASGPIDLTEAEYDGCVYVLECDTRLNENAQYRSVVEHGKTRTLTVTRGPFEAERTYRADALLVECEGYGTEYTIEIPINKGQRPQLLYPSGPATNLVVFSIELQGAGERGDADAEDVDTKDVGPEEIKSDTSIVDYLDGELR